MNIRSILLFSAILTIGTINTGPIRERLAKERAIADAKVKEKAENLQKEGYTHLDASNLPRRIALEIHSGYGLTIRSSLLTDILNCMDRNTSIDEQEATDQCYCELSNRLKHAKYMHQGEKELTQKEFEKIGNKDLRQSWFWWLP